MESPKPNNRILPVWIYLWLISFGLMLILSLVNPNGDAITIIKLGGIGLCLLYVAITFPKDYLLLAAMLATSIADIILANNNISPIGITVFIATQLLHLIHLQWHALKVPIIIYLCASIIIITLDYIFNFIPILFLTCGFYAILLITNIITSALWHYREPRNPRATMAFFGFILFFCCDFCTVLSFFSLMEVFPAALYAPANFFVWLFYYPSQILLSNTGKYAIMRSTKKVTS